MLFDRDREFCYHRFLGQRSEDHILLYCTPRAGVNIRMVVEYGITFVCSNRKQIIISFVVLIGEYQTMDSSNFFFLFFFIIIMLILVVPVHIFQSLTTARRPHINVIAREVIAII